MSILAWIVIAVIVFATLSPIGLRPQTGHVRLERFAAFFLLGALATGAYPRRAGWVLAAVCLLAVMLELAQTLTPGRHGRVIDALEKLAGGVSGVAFAVALLATVACWRGRN